MPPSPPAWSPSFGPACSATSPAVGRLHDAVDAMVWQNLAYAGGGGGGPLDHLLAAVMPTHLLTPVLLWAIAPAAVVAVAAVVNGRRTISPHWRLWLFWAAGAWGMVVAPGYFLAHYYQLLMPPLCVAGGWAAAGLLRRPGVLPRVAVVAALVAVVVRQGSQYRLSPERWARDGFADVPYFDNDFARHRAVGRQLDALLRPGETFWNLGEDNTLYFASGRSPPVGLLYLDPVVVGPDIPGHWRRLMADLDRAPARPDRRQHADGQGARPHGPAVPVDAGPLRRCPHRRPGPADVPDLRPPRHRPVPPAERGGEEEGREPGAERRELGKTPNSQLPTPNSQLPAPGPPLAPPSGVRNNRRPFPRNLCPHSRPAQIRQQYIAYFQQRHAHAFVPSSPVVPHDDPTLLFTNAGMNQYKPIFLGQEVRDYTRAVNTQKCIRAGGKHNDLDDVGRSRRHHTFFEMLGNWSFGDYFKRGAIEMAWDLLTNVWGLDPSRLHVTCFEGSPGVPRDTEAAAIWKEVAGLSDDHIHYFGKDNFWEMGDTGPCGPCTEIYVDRTPDKTGGPEVNGSDPRVMEIWNLVFIQYNRDAHGKLTELPAQHVDTGMGLERICQVIQGKADNFATDLWTPIFDKITALSGKRYAGTFPPTNSVDPAAEAADEQLRHDIAFRVVADHVRCLTFALTDGAVPSNEGRGYVLRRILRRAVRFGRQQLGLTEPFMHQLVPVIAESMGDAFPELRMNPVRVAGLIKDEEVSFGKTLDRGIQLFDQAYREAIYKVSAASPSVYGAVPRPISEWQERAVASFENRGTGFMARVAAPVIAAADAFKLHDTYGFPIDLTRIMAEERGLSVDIAGYERLMEGSEAEGPQRRQGRRRDEAADRAAAGRAGAAGRGRRRADGRRAEVRPRADRRPGAGHLERRRLGPVPGHGGRGRAAGHHSPPDELLRRDGRASRRRRHADSPDQFGRRQAQSGRPSVFDVEATKAVGGYVLHVGRLRSGAIQVGETVTATVGDARTATEQNHTTTHLANWALREVLGDEVQQKGSLVDPEKLRFDFSHGKSLSDEELARVETLVGKSIERKLPVYAEEAAQELALKINGLRAVFGEKYPPKVRVVSVGVPVSELLADPTNAKWRGHSVEFCGGTHLGNSGDAGGFAITAEESVSKGVRRLVAVTGEAAVNAQVSAEEVAATVAKGKAASDDQLPPIVLALTQMIADGGLPLRAKRAAQSAVVEFQARQKQFEKLAKRAGGTDAVAAVAELLASAPSVGDGKLVVGEIVGATDDGLRSAVDSIKAKSPSYAAMLAAAADGKVTFVAAVSDDLIARGLKAGDWVRETAKAAGGGGGGRPNHAQAGGKDPAKLGEALDVARAYAGKVLDT